MAIVTDGLVLYLHGACGKNNPATRVWKDLSGNGNDGELVNFGYTEDSGWVDGGLRFDEVDDWIYCGQVPELNKDGTPKMAEVNGVMTPKVKIKNLYPGYIFVEMIMTDDSWFMVRNTQGVTGIAGSSGGGQKPTPVSAREMETVLKRMGVVDKSMYEQYHIGDLVKIIHGTFANVEGKIVSIDKDSGNVRVDTIFFGRHTPVDVEFSEIVRS